MLYSNKMIYQAPKYHSNSFSHFLQLHSNHNNNNNNNNNHSKNDNSITTSENINLNHGESAKLEINNDSNSNTSTTSLEVVNESAGKSFTIAAILGLNKSRQNCGLDDGNNLSDYNQDFTNLINLSAHSKLFQKFDNENRHGFMTQHTSSSEHQMDHQSIYDNNNASNSSSYPEHLHKPDFSTDYTRNDETNNPVIRNHIHQHTVNNNNLLNKAFNRERSRLETFTNRNNKSSISLKNKRVRTIFTPEQLERLEAEFERQQYMVGPERLYLAHTLQLTEAQVKVWFQNRRIKWRKHHLEITQQHLAIARQRQIPAVPIPSTSRNLSSEESRHSDDQCVSDGDD